MKCKYYKVNKKDLTFTLILTEQPKSTESDQLEELDLAQRGIKRSFSIFYKCKNTI